MMWASLSNSPPPPCQEDGVTAYETETKLIGRRQIESDRIAHLQLDKILSNRPMLDPLSLIDPTGSKLVRSKSVSSAKSAFLNPSSTKVKKVQMTFHTWYEEGWIAALEELATYSSRQDSSTPAKLVGAFAGHLLNLWRNTFNIYGAFNRNMRIGDEEVASKYSSTRDWTRSVVRCMAWHPQTPKLALALRDDTIHIVGVNLQVSPVLKHKQQRGVTCLAWRPFLSCEFAVGSLTGIFIWTVDPMSVVARPSANCVCILPTPPNHTSINGLVYHPDGKYLMSHSATDSSVIVWCSSSERRVPLKCINRFHDGIHLAAWSPKGGAAMIASTCSIFKILNTNNWTQERWSVVGGYVNSACWSECGTSLLFTTSEDTQVFCLKFDVGENNFSSAGSAVPVMDLSKVAFQLDDGEDISAGGLVQCMRWDPNNLRLVVSYVDCPVLSVLCTRVDQVGVSVSPIGFIRGQPDEMPTSFEFAKDFKDGGALLTIAWSSGRIQHFPMLFSLDGVQIPSTRENSYQLSTSAEFNPMIFSSPAVEF